MTSTTKPFIASHFQEAIFTWIDTGRGNAMVNAVAGSGKSTTLVEAAKRLATSNAIFFAFNKHIAEELSAKLAGHTKMVAKTIHGFGNGILLRAGYKPKLDNNTKYRDLVRQELRQNPRFAYMENSPNSAEKQRWNAFVKALVKLVDFARITLRHDPMHMTQVIGKYQIDIEPLFADDLIKMIPAVLTAGANVAKYSIDFTDMLWLPIRLNLKVPTFEWIFVDESQDLSALQQELVIRACGPGGRMLFVGDSRQAIMGFAGADAQSFANIAKRVNATELPLSICYRCPTSHLDLARAIVPQIEAAPNAIEGSVEYIDELAFLSAVKEGDMVLCRMTAPLVSQCIKLIKARVPARVKGRDVANDLCDLVEKLGAQVEWDSFLTALNSWKLNQIAYLVQQEASEDTILNVTDRAEAITACYTGFGASNAAQLCGEIKALFSDDRASVTLSTVHRAKGLEADTVFILKPSKLPLMWPGQTEDQATQELNLRYVALTRSKNRLIFVNEPQA